MAGVAEEEAAWGIGVRRLKPGFLGEVTASLKRCPDTNLRRARRYEIAEIPLGRGGGVGGLVEPSGERVQEDRGSEHGD